MNSIFRNLGVWLLIGLVMLILFNMIETNQSSEQRVAFSDFLNQVKTGAILDVVVRGDRAIGLSDNQGRIQTEVPNYPELFDVLNEYKVKIRIESTGQGSLILA